MKELSEPNVPERKARRCVRISRQPSQQAVSGSKQSSPTDGSKFIRSPLYEAQNAPRYERQKLIRSYQETYQCRLVVMCDTLFPPSITLFEEALFDADPEQDLHIIFYTQGGDGETALRLVRQAQARCKKLTVIVPDQAKSAGTLFALGSHRIYMGPTSDLGPVDPQFLIKGSLVAAKAIIAAVDNAEKRIQKNPATYPLHASLLADVTAVMVEQARDALARAGDILSEALACVPERSKEEVTTLSQKLQAPLIQASSHRAIISTEDAASFGLPVEKAAPASDRWQDVWRLWTKYAALNATRVYEGSTASYVVPSNDMAAQ